MLCITDSRLHAVLSVLTLRQSPYVTSTVTLPVETHLYEMAVVVVVIVVDVIELVAVLAVIDVAGSVVVTPAPAVVQVSRSFCSCSQRLPA